MAVGLKEIGKKLKLSPATVSRALRNKRELNAQGVPYISDATVARVLKTAREMGYRPNHSARSLALGKTMRIALWVPDVASRSFQEIFCGFHDYLRTVGYDIILFELPSRQQRALTDFSDIFRTDVDGVLLYGGTMGNNDVERKQWINYPSEISVVNMGIVQNTDLFDYLHIDAYPAVVEAMEHLLKTNRKKIVHVLTKNTKWDGDPRYQAYVDVLKKAGKKPEFLVIDADANGSQRSSALKGICEYLKVNECPEAFFCATDDIAIGLYRGLRDLGIKIPEDVAIVGFDGIVETEYFDPRISTIVHPMDEICTKAWELLSRRMKNKDIPLQEVSVKAFFRLRGSSQGRN